MGSSLTQWLNKLSALFSSSEDKDLDQELSQVKLREHNSQKELHLKPELTSQELIACPGLSDTLSYEFASQYMILPLEETSSHIVCAVADPYQPLLREKAQALFGKPIHFKIGVGEQIQAAIEATYQKKLEDVDNQAQEVSSEGLIVYDLLQDVAGENLSTRVLNTILIEAIDSNASDVHFEPFENDASVRFRIDGVLFDQPFSHFILYNQIIARIKVMSNLDIAERRRPQDGRIKLRKGSREVDFRVSTIPVINGERVVLRLLNQDNVVVGLEGIGMPAEILNTFRQHTTYPEGIILVTGPTGSGKTTTLYSVMSELDQQTTNIMTVEDPVEYKLPGISQIGVNPKIGLTFAQGLRHILRQDPDVILIGEIRDQETASIAVQSSLTGHLVFSTLHTNDAPSSITRLIDMGVEPYLVSSSVIAILAQRLVRTICPHCKQEDTNFKQMLGQGFDADHPFQSIDKAYIGAGCEACHQTGYKGRSGLFELLLIDESLRSLIAQTSDANEIKKCAQAQGMKTLLDHGALLIREGKTSFEEVWRMTRG